jgi:4-diphosphocytidyl-2-C-methyl-D-erythritol kinase
MALIETLAPAKINLFLHVTGRRDDGYHLLESLVAFADIGDEITIEQAATFELQISGPFAKDLDPSAQNYISKAVLFLANHANRNPDIRVKLTKRLPVASGIGGGSSDAAATLLACQRLWRIPMLPTPEDIIAALGADVPVCLRRRPTLMRGVGEQLADVGPLPEGDIVVINPGTGLATADVFRKYSGPFSQPLTDIPAKGWRDMSELAQFINATHNDLEAPAMALVPAIGTVLQSLSAQTGCLAARMSGSGATCFGLFGNSADAARATLNIARAHTTWWVQAGRFLPPEPAPGRAV